MGTELFPLTKHLESCADFYCVLFMANIIVCVFHHVDCKNPCNNFSSAFGLGHIL